MCFQKVWKNFRGIENVPSQELEVIQFPWDLNSGSFGLSPSLILFYPLLSFLLKNQQPWKRTEDTYPFANQEI